MTLVRLMKIRHNETQYHEILLNENQYNKIQRNDTQHKGLKDLFLTLSINDDKHEQHSITIT